MERTSCGLDPLTVAKFNGSLENWLAFKDSLETLIPSQELPETYKLTKLCEATINGDARDLIGGTYTGSYQEVWEALKRRYDQPRHLASIHIACLLDMPTGQQETLALVDHVGVVMRALTVMELPVEYWNVIAIEIVQRKVPAATRQAWGMECRSNEIPTPRELLEFVERSYIAEHIWQCAESIDIDHNELTPSHRLAEHFKSAH